MGIVLRERNMTKIDAIEKVMKDNGGTASLSLIYENICKY